MAVGDPGGRRSGAGPGMPPTCAATGTDDRWPPGRDEPCWCGSAHKAMKWCAGRARLPLRLRRRLDPPHRGAPTPAATRSAASTVRRPRAGGPRRRVRFTELLATLADPRHTEHEQMREWTGRPAAPVRPACGRPAGARNEHRINEQLTVAVLDQAFGQLTPEGSHRAGSPTSSGYTRAAPRPGGDRRLAAGVPPGIREARRAILLTSDARH